MNPSADPDTSDSGYTLDVTAAITGLSSQTILHYHEAGLIRSAPGSEEGGVRFDDDALRTLRRIEHLAASCEMNLAGLRLLLALTEEVERLRDQLRSRR